MIFDRDGHGIWKFAASVVYARICQYANVVENLIYIYYSLHLHKMTRLDMGRGGRWIKRNIQERERLEMNWCDSKQHPAPFNRLLAVDFLHFLLEHYFCAFWVQTNHRGSEGPVMWEVMYIFIYFLSFVIMFCCVSPIEKIIHCLVLAVGHYFRCSF